MNLRRTIVPILVAGLVLAAAAVLSAQVKPVPRFPIEPSDIRLHRDARPGTYFDKVGRTFAVLGEESGTIEAWAYPLKLFRGCGLSFFIGSSTEPVAARDIVRWVDVDPASTTLTYVFQSFTVKATFVTSVRDPGAVILLAVDATEPLTVVCGFLPVLQPMWPAGIGGQYARWDDALNAYLISEPTRKNHGFIGSPAASGISYTPAHMLSDTPNQFKIEIPDPAVVRDVYLPIVLAGGKGVREDIRKVYEKIAADPEAVYREAVDHYRRLRADTLRIRTPRRDLDLAFEWAKIAFDNLLVDNPDLGLGLVAGLGLSGTGGRPGFGWFFGGDAFMNSLSLSGYGAWAEVKSALLFARKWQREDGKMAHELSQAAGYLDWFGDYPYAYIHGDTTPFYIAACLDYYRWSGDREFVLESWPSILKAYAWCRTTDEDGDGLMDNSKAGLGALEFGALTGIKTDIYLAAAWARAALAVSELARVAGDPEVEAEAKASHDRARAALNDKFWNETIGQYAYAFNADGKQVAEITPWSALPIVWGLTEPERAGKTLERLNAADMTTDWGVRMLSKSSPYYEPLNYNYGAAWPFLTGWAATAMFERNYALQGYGLLQAAVRHTFDNGLGVVTELFSGDLNVWPQEGVAHQGFSSSGVTLPLLRGLLGLSGDAAAGTLRFAPRFPADWTRVEIENVRLGEGSCDFIFRRETAKAVIEVRSRSPRPLRLTVAPAFGLGTRVRAASVDGRGVKLPADSRSWDQAVQPSVEAAVGNRTVFEFAIDPCFEILPPENPTRTGDPSRGLRIIRSGWAKGTLSLTVEGIAGETYRLGLVRPDLVGRVRGARLVDGGLAVRIPGNGVAGFARHTIALARR